MHARVASFNLGEGVDQTVDQIRGDVESGNRPPGLEDAKGMMMLVDRSTGKSLGITLFDSEERDEEGRRGAERDVAFRRWNTGRRRVLRGRRPDDGVAHEVCSRRRPSWAPAVFSRQVSLLS